MLEHLGHWGGASMKKIQETTDLWAPEQRRLHRGRAGSVRGSGGGGEPWTVLACDRQLGELSIRQKSFSLLVMDLKN